MSWLYLIILFFFGTILGSFLNVLTLRYKPEQNVFAPASIGGRSRCFYCQKTLNWFELIPIFSFLIQDGRCRNCRARLSFQYPIIEFLTGAIFVIVPIFFSSFYKLSANLDPVWFYLSSAIWITAFLIWLLIAAIDLRHYLIPDELNLILGVLGIIFIIVSLKQGLFLNLGNSFLKHYGLLFSFSTNSIFNHIFGAVVSGLFFGSMSILSGGRAMGFGDAKLAFVSGLLLGWPDIGLAIILSFLIGGIFGAATLLIKKKTMKSLLPFAPFFVLGVVLTVFFGVQIINLYFRLFQIG